MEKLRLLWELSQEHSGGRATSGNLTPPIQAGIVPLGALPTPEGPGQVAPVSSRRCAHRPPGLAAAGAAAAPMKRAGGGTGGCPTAAAPLGGAVGQGTRPVQAGRPRTRRSLPTLPAAGHPA